MDVKLSRAQREEAGIRFTGHIRLAHQIAARYARTYGLPHGDLVEESETVLGEICSRWWDQTMYGYKSEKCNPTSWIYRLMNWKLLDYCNRRRRFPVREFSTLGVEEKPLDLPEVEGWFVRLSRTLGEDARILVHTVLFAPAEILDDVVAARGRRAVLMRAKGFDAVSLQLGWSMDRFDRAWDEVAEAI